MNPIRREVLNGLFVLVISTLLSAVITAFEIKVNLQVWVLIVMAVAIAVSGYVMFEIALGVITSGVDREKEWLKRVGTPARLELGMGEGTAGTALMVEAVKAMRPGGDLTLVIYIDPEGGSARVATEVAFEQIFGSIMEQLKRGSIREYKQLICYDHDVFANGHELKSGVLRVGEGPGTIDRKMGEHCRVMLETKGCSLYLAPAVLRLNVTLYGVDKVSISVDAFDQGTGSRRLEGIMFFSDPPNGEIIEQFRQLERATERRMVAVHKIVFPEDAEPTAELSSRLEK
jgi:hypothetical protein